VGFGFMVIHEVFVDVFRAFHTLRDLGTVLFKWAGLVMLLVAAVVSVSTNSSQVAPWMQAIVTSQRCVRMIQVGMILFLLFFAHYVGVSRRQYSFGIALGFGVMSTADFILAATSHSSLTDNVQFVYESLILVVLGLWVAYAALPEPARKPMLLPVNSTIYRWNEIASALGHTGTQVAVRQPVNSSLLTDVESVVDRVLSKNLKDRKSET